MEPQAIQTPNTAGNQPVSSVQPPQNSASSQSSLDPEAVNLAKAIRQTESGGNFKAKGKSGEYGAYQWEPNTWTNEAKAAGITAPLDQATPEQQNEVAYKKIESLKSQGYNPAQIASEWNSGEPDAYTGEFSNGHPSIGKNAEGVDYNVPDYVNKVTSTYQKFKGNSNPLVSTAQAASSPTDTQKSSQPSWLEALEGVGAAGLGWLASEGAGVAKQALPVIGAGVGEAIEPLGGGIPGEVVGQGLANLIPGNSQDKNTPSESPQSQPEQSNLETEFPQSINASNAVKDAISRTIGSTQAGRAYSATPAGQDAINTASVHGLITPDEEGNLSFNEEKLKKLESAIEEGKDGIIASQEHTTASPFSVANYAGSFIGRDRLNTAADKKKAAEIIQEEMNADSGGVGMNGQMSLGDMRKAQKTHYRAAKASYINPKPNAEMLAHKALGEAYGKAIRDKIGDEDKPLYDKLTKTSRDLTNVKNLKKKVEGKKAPKNKGIWESFLRQGARAAEIYIGDKLGGPIGAIIGGLAGEHINRKIENKFGRNIFETKGMKAALDILHDTRPKEYTKLIEALRKRNIEISETKVPLSEKGKVEDVKKDENSMEGRLRGLISLNSGKL